MKKLFSAIGLLLVVSLVNAFAQQNKAESGAATPKTATAAAVSYGIVVDNSGSFRSILEKVIEITKDIVEENKANDETFLVRFVSTDKIQLLQDFTISKDELHAAADEMYPEGGLTAILDAVDFAARHLVEKASSEPATRRKALILLTDGDDRKSKAKIEEVLKFLKDNQVQVYVFGISDEKVSTKIIDKLTRETGGKKFVPKTTAEISAMVKELSAALRAQ
ncbi:MAG TPA: VWA domain-containing protein [Pyrinomonadaceae bacterium]|nr:VWA domain-containing protein [Pyrinomonadaceae bacterium]